MPERPEGCCAQMGTVPFSRGRVDKESHRRRRDRFCKQVESLRAKAAVSFARSAEKNDRMGCNRTCGGRGGTSGTFSSCNFCLARGIAFASRQHTMIESIEGILWVYFTHRASAGCGPQSPLGFWASSCTMPRVAYRLKRAGKARAARPRHIWPGMFAPAISFSTPIFPIARPMISPRSWRPCCGLCPHTGAGRCRARSSAT